MKISALSGKTIVRLPLLAIIAATPFPAGAWQQDVAEAPSEKNAPSGQPCRLVGQVFGADRVARSFILKLDNGDLTNVSYDDSTAFLRAGTSTQAGLPRVSPGELGLGDRLCVDPAQVGSRPRASRVLVTFRTDIAARGKSELIRWQAHSVFGIVSALDQQTHRITLDVSNNGSRQSLTVDASGKAAYWIFPRGSTELVDAVHSSWDRISAGDAIYVHGHRDIESGPLLAGLIIAGGFRSFVGEIESIEALNSLVRIRDFVSGKTRLVSIGFNRIYVVGRPPGSYGADERKLYRSFSFSDLRPNDSVLVLGREEGQSDRLLSLALITGFSSFGAFAPEHTQQMHWIFESLGIGAR